jgi:tetratricopeptide (TPR) repeat protein/predicted Ser/Thr protein kinase
VAFVPVSAAATHETREEADKRESRRAKAACPDDTAISGYCKRTIAKETIEQVERHLRDCTDCRALVGWIERGHIATDATIPSFEGMYGPAAAGELSCGKYRLGKCLGAGGMGLVYEAYDPDLQRVVAIKLLRPHGDEDVAPLRQRLVREAQAMAKLSHPNVVAVHEVGLHDKHVFIAMEMVDGRTLRNWVAEDKPDWRAIVAAYRQAGQALAAAHALGIVHRDFKPDNALIDKDGRVRVLDFGLAQLDNIDSNSVEPMSSAVSERGIASRIGIIRSLTRAGMVLGTPAYMAPEQHFGRSVGPAADQFSFCVALYEALWRERPFAGETMADLAECTIAGKPREPRRRGGAPPWMFRPLARGLMPAPEDRYPAMGALLAALDRDPARALRRWLVAAVGLLAVVVVLGALIRSERRAWCSGAAQELADVWNNERRRDVHAAFVATHKPFAENAFATVSRVLDGYFAAWSAMHVDSCTATRVRREQSEEVMELRMECLDRRREEARALIDVFAQADEKVVERAAQAVESLSSLDECRNANALRQVMPPPGAAEARARIASVHTRLANFKARYKAGQYADARKLAESAVADARALAYPPALAEALHALGFVQARTGDLQLAANTLMDAVATADAGRYDHERAAAYQTLVGVVGDRLKRTQEARGYCASGRAALARAGGDPRLEALLDDSEALILQADGRYEEALALHQSAVSRLERLPGFNEADIAAIYHNIGLVRTQRGEFAESIASYRRSLAMLQGLYGDNHPRTANSWNGLGDAWCNSGDARSALLAFEHAYTIRQALLDANHPDLATSLLNLGCANTRLGRFDAALPLLNRALAIQTRALHADHPNMGYTEVSLAELYLRMRRLDDALIHGKRGLAILEAARGQEHPDVAQALTWLGLVQVARHDYSSAFATLERAVTILQHHPADPQLLAHARFALACAFWDSGRDRTRARTLAMAAQEHLVWDRQEVTQWLTTHH